MNRVIKPLSKFGAKFEDNAGKLPVSISCSKKLKPITYLESLGSAQCKSAVMIAALKTFGNTKITLQGRFESAMKYWKDLYQNDYEIDENNQYIEYFVYYDHLRIIHICPETNFMTINPDEIQKHKIYNAILHD